MANLTQEQTKATLEQTIAHFRRNDAEKAMQDDDAKLKELMMQPPAGEVTLAHIEQIQAQLREIREILLSMQASQSSSDN